MRFTITILVAVVLAGSLSFPVAAQAASLTTDQVTAVVALLQSFNVDVKTVQTVQAVLTNTQPSRPSLEDEGGFERERWNPGQTGKMMCIALARNLGPGSYGEDVRDLQRMLAEDKENGFVGTTTGYYGPLTAKAMMRFQIRNGIASTTTGTVGPLTRGFFERRCGKGLLKMHEKFGTTTLGMTASGTPPQPSLNQGTSTGSQ